MQRLLELHLLRLVGLLEAIFAQFLRSFGAIFAFFGGGTSRFMAMCVVMVVHALNAHKCGVAYTPGLNYVVSTV